MARAPRADWRTDHQLWIEVFVLFNFAGLVARHLSRAFGRTRSAGQRIHPAVLLGGGAAVLLAGLALRGASPALWRDVGHLIGWLAVVIGLAGVILHLDSQFFHDRTIKSLTYAAPFAAPLAYTGLGLLLIVNRMVEPDDLEWAHWVLLLALGGFVGNFVFSLTDHALNGFFHPVGVASGRQQRVCGRLSAGAVPDARRRAGF